MASPMKMPMKMVECDCGFMVRSGMDDEMVKMVQMHAKDQHQTDLPREGVMQKAKPAQM